MERKLSQGSTASNRGEINDAFVVILLGLRSSYALPDPNLKAYDLVGILGYKRNETSVGIETL
jgi:hypothetical protein